MKLMNSETHSWTVSLASLAIFPLAGSAFFMMRLMLAIGRYLSCSRTLERGLWSPLSWLPPPGLDGPSAIVAGTLIWERNNRWKTWGNWKRRNPNWREGVELLCWWREMLRIPVMVWISLYLARDRWGNRTLEKKGRWRRLRSRLKPITTVRFLLLHNKQTLLSLAFRFFLHPFYFFLFSYPSFFFLFFFFNFSI